MKGPNYRRVLLSVTAFIIVYGCLLAVLLELEEGDGVRHQLFGVGTVLELDGDNATIYFKGKGTKKLNIAFAPLEKI